MRFRLQDRTRVNPRLFAGVWFGCAGGIAIIVIPMIYVLISGSGFGRFDPFIAVAALAGFGVAFVPGVLLGGPILARPASLPQSILRGMGVALCADLLFVIGLAISSADGRWEFFLLGLSSSSLWIFLVLALPVLLIGGAAGWLLRRLPGKPGEEPNSAAGE